MRVRDIFFCRSVVVVEEVHPEGGFHYHAGVFNETASRWTAAKVIRNEFKEWEGKALDVSFHKSWSSVVKYVLKEDLAPHIWGEYTLKELQEIIHCKSQHKKIEESHSAKMLRRLEGMRNVLEIYEDELFKEKVFSSLPRIKEAHEDLQVLKMMKDNVLERIQEFLKSRGSPLEYSIEEIQEKSLLLDWLACQLCCKRPIKTKQIFVYGEPSTQKTLLFQMLQKILNIYFVSSRRNDFTGANDFYDLWVFDEFHEPSEESRMFGATEEGTTYSNTILKVLDGQECRLDSKYGRVFKKRKNVPIVMIANKLPTGMRQEGPFRARFLRLRFSSNIKNLEEERIIATLWGCIQRRLSQFGEYPIAEAQEKEEPEDAEIMEQVFEELEEPGDAEGIEEKQSKEKAGKSAADAVKKCTLSYNECEGILITAEEQVKERQHELEKIRRRLQRRVKESPEELEKGFLLTREGHLLILRGETQIRVISEGEDAPKKAWQGLLVFLAKDNPQFHKKRGIMSLIDFAMIPLKKKDSKEPEGPNKEESPLDPFKRIGEVSNTSKMLQIEGQDSLIAHKHLFEKEETPGYLV